MIADKFRQPTYLEASASLLYAQDRSRRTACRALPFRKWQQQQQQQQQIKELQSSPEPTQRPTELNVSSYQSSSDAPAVSSSQEQFPGPLRLADGPPELPRNPPGEAAYQVLIELRNVHKSFGSKRVLRGTNIQIRRGEAVGIIGGSGSGKSTTLRLMAGLQSPDWGEVRIKGHVRSGVIGDDPGLEGLLQIGMVFQHSALFDSLTVGDNVGFLLQEHTSLPPTRIQALVARSLEAVGLKNVEQLYPAELSGGMQKRVALARAIIRDYDNPGPEQVIMYDEPTAGLDPVASTVVEDLIRSLRMAPRGSDGGVASYIVVTHQHSTIRRAVDRLIFLHQGKVMWEGTTEEFDSSEEAIVKQFRTGNLAGPIRYD